MGPGRQTFVALADPTRYSGRAEKGTVSCALPSLW
jgi:hypothetical protein